MPNLTVMTVDAPWSWNDKLPGGRGADEHMPKSLSTEQIAATRLPPLTDDAVLFLWRPASRLGDALEVCLAWGFTPKTEIVWIKRTATGKRHFGMGRIVRGEHEICMVATRGKPQVVNKSVRSTFEAESVPYGKPPEFYALVHELYPHAIWWDRTNKGWSQGWKQYRFSTNHALAR